MRNSVLSLVLLFAGWSMAWGQQQVPRAYLGIQPAPPAANSNAIVIGDVDPNGPAGKAGLKSGDRIVRVDDQAPASLDAFTDMLSKHKPGDKLSFVVQRDGKEEKINVTLSERPAEGAPPATDRNQGRERDRDQEAPRAFLGVAMQDMSPQLKQRLGVNVDQGVIVAEVTPNSPAAKAGLQNGDVITQANGKAITASRQLFDAIQQVGAGKEVNLKVARGSDTRDVKVTLAEPPADLGRTRIPGLGGPGSGFPRIDIPRIGGDGDRMRALEKKIDDLEKRIQELEKRNK